MEKRKRILFGFITFSIMIVLALIALELTARYGFDLGDPIVYEDNDIMGYRMKPNQIVKRRNGNKIYINSFGCRGPEPDKNALRILVLGDSVTYGGSTIFNHSLFTTLMQDKINASHIFGKQRVQVLNCGTNGYSFEHAVRFLQLNGKAIRPDMVLAVFPSHGFFRTFSKGNVPAFQRKKPVFALQEVAQKWLPIFWNTVIRRETKYTARKQFIEKNFEPLCRENYRHIDEMAGLSRKLGARFMISLVPVGEELGPGSPAYNARLRRELSAFTASKKIPEFNAVELYRKSGGATLFIDGMHLNTRGHKILGGALAEFIIKANRG